MTVNNREATIYFSHSSVQTSIFFCSICDLWITKIHKPKNSENVLFYKAVKETLSVKLNAV